MTPRLNRYPSRLKKLISSFDNRLISPLWLTEYNDISSRILQDLSAVAYGAVPSHYGTVTTSANEKPPLHPSG
jgi:hypothetical protein